MKRYFVPAIFLSLIILLPVENAFSELVARNGTGRQKVLVIMVRFPDVKPSFDRKAIEDKYFNKLNRYLKDVSYNKTSVEGRLTDWYTLPQSVRHYRLSQHNLSVDNDRVTALIRDSINLADNDHNFSKYSMIFISLGAKREAYGMMGLCGYPGMLGWTKKLPLKTRKKGQEIPGGAAIFCENAHVGVLFHDMAHIMGGVEGGRRILPCLYDHDLQGEKGNFRDYAKFYLINVGEYDPMSCHYYDIKKGPPGPCAWTRLRLGWIEPKRIAEVPRGESRTVTLGPLNDRNSKILAARLPIDEYSYYLVENRAAVGADRNLPAHGVCVYFCDDRVEECRHGRTPVKMIDANPEMPWLRGAPFTVKGNNEYLDRKYGVTIRLIKQKGTASELVLSSNLN